MAEAFAQSVLKVAMAQICQNLGWHAVQTSPLNILIDILHRYLTTLAKTTHDFAEHDNRTIPNLNDLGLAFKEIGISLAELEEYVNNVEPVPFVHPVPQFPVQRNSQFHFPKEGCREVQHRPEWIYPHLPATHPELEEEESVLSPATSPDNKLSVDGLMSTSAEIGLASPTGSPRPGIRRPLEITQDTNFSTPKRPRLQSDEDGRPMREVMSVIMTAAGVISPVREGILPDARTPSKGFEDSRPNSPVLPEIQEPVPSPSTPPAPEPKKEQVKKEGSLGKIKKNQKGKEGKKLKVKKDNKENKKKSLKEGKLKKKDSISKTKGGDKPPKIKKEKSPKKSSLGKGSKSPKAAKPKSLKPKIPKSSDKSKPSSSSKEGMAKPTAKLAKKHGAKSPKSPKGSKPKGKSPKSEKQVAGGQLASLLAKASGAATIKAEKKDGDMPKAGAFFEKDLPSVKSELPDTPSVCDSPERLVIDDNPEIGEVEVYKREARMGNVNDCISAVIQRGMHDGEQHTTNSNSSSNARSDSEGLSSIPSKVKLEPRDVYDFTDDEDLPDTGKSLDESASQTSNMGSPVHKRMKDDDSDKIKDVKKTKRKDGEKKVKKPKAKSPRYGNVKVESENVMDNMWPKTPEPTEDSGDEGSPYPVPQSYMPTMLSPSALSSLSHIPPALLPFSMQQAFAPASLRSPGLSAATSAAPHVQYPKLVDLADVAISKARHEGDFDIGKPKEKERGEKDKGKRKEKREKKEKDKLKVKKKKDKAKEKVAAKGAVEKDRDKVKGKKEKIPSGKVKEKKEKPEKGRDKDKKKEQEKDKTKEKKLDKKKKEKAIKKEKLKKIPKEDPERDCASPSIPRLTFKLGSGMTSEGTKIVIKGISNDSPLPSPVPPPKEPTPPVSPVLPALPHRLPPVVQGPTSSTILGKSHPKPQTKVQPVPSAPARTVITETIGTIIDESGNKIWICPACTHPDDGSPMIGCDDCDEWYHWVCVGIVVPPKEDENWFCTRCIAKKQSTQKKRKHRKDK